MADWGPVSNYRNLRADLTHIEMLRHQFVGLQELINEVHYPHCDDLAWHIEDYESVIQLVNDGESKLSNLVDCIFRVERRKLDQLLESESAQRPPPSIDV